MSSDNAINLQDAAFFSALAYATPGESPEAWAFAKGGVYEQAAQALLSPSGDWQELTQSLLNQFVNADGSVTYFDKSGDNAFRVFVNSSTHEVVFAFKGSSVNWNNWLSDAETSDQGFTQYQAIQAAAEALYTEMTQPGSQYASYQFFADGHSLGGGMAQTFAAQNDISGFGQNSLPIAPNSQSSATFFPTSKFPDGFTSVISDYSTSGATFQEVNLQGDLASAVYHTVLTGGYYLDSNLTQWLSNDGLGATAGALAGIAGAIGGPGLAVLADSGISHELAAFIPAAIAQIPAGGIGFSGATPDSSALQTLIADAAYPLLEAVNTSGVAPQGNGSFTFGPGWLGPVVNLVESAWSATPETPDGNVGATAGNSAPLNIATGSATQNSVITGTSGGSAVSDLLIATGAPTELHGGSGANTLVGGTGDTTLYGGSGTNTYLYLNPNSTPDTTATIVDPHGTDVLEVGTVQLTGTSTTGSDYQWTDASGTEYQFTPGQGFSQTGFGTLVISNGVLGADNGNEIAIQNFNLSLAGARPNGFMGITLPESLALTAGANLGTGGPATFAAGSEQSYTLSVDAPSAFAQTVTVTLSGANAGDFEVDVGQSTLQLSQQGYQEGSFTVTLPAGATNISFGLVDITSDNGSSDIAGGATLQLTAAIPNLTNPSGPAIQSTPLTIDYTPESPDTSTAPQTDSVINGTVSGGVTTYQGDGLDDYIAAGAGPNLIQASDSGSDSIIGGSGSNTIYGGSGNDVISLNGSQDLVFLGNGFNTLSGSASGADTIFGQGGSAIISGAGGTDLIFVGNGNNQIYADSENNLQTAIADALSGTATGQQGDLLSVLDGNNTIVSGDGNDLVTTGTGHDVIVLGPGDDTFEGGIEVTDGLADWSTTVTHPNGPNSYLLTLENVDGTVEPFSNPYLQPYNAPSYSNGFEVGAGNDTIFTGNGNDLIFLPNGNNRVQLGSGSDSVFGGMGNATIVAGSGADLIGGGGGTDYIYGGSGADTLQGGDGNNTIIGGSGNATIASATGPSTTWANENLEQNYVTGGSGNDLIYGSGGSDTLIGGSGNVTIEGGTGNENITGGSGNDLLVGGPGNDTIAAGGSGNDSLYANGSSTSTSVLYGGSGTDLIEGGSGTNILYAGDGGTAEAPTSVFASTSDSTSNTTIYGGAGVDWLQGSVGSTVIYAGDGGTAAAPTTIVADSGNTTIYGGLGTDEIEGGAGTDVLYVGDGGTATAPSSLTGGTGVATLYGGAGPGVLVDLQSGQDMLFAGTSNDTLVGTGSDTLVAGPGNDLLQTDGGSVTFDINAGFGDDTVHTDGGTADVVFGTGMAPTDFTGSVAFDASGNSYLNLTGDGGSVELEDAFTGGLSSVDFADSGSVPPGTLLSDAFGGDVTVAHGSSNLIVGVENNDSLSAGLYYDTISSWGSNSTISGGTNYDGDVIYSAGASASIASGTGTDTINATGNNDSLRGGDFADLITVSGANSIVTSVSGNDTLTASGVSDTLVGGAGNSTFVINNASTVISAPSGGGQDAILASVSYAAPTNVNVLTLTGSANLVAVGNSAGDTLTGGAGSDTLIAGTSADTLVGGTGNTTFVVNNASDVVEDTHGATNDTVQSSVSFTLASNVNTLELTGSAALVATANSGSATLVSNSGADTLKGGSGNDTFIVASTAVVVQDTASGAHNTISSAVSYTLPTDVNDLVLTGTGNLTATANSANDTLVSNSGVDTLVGGSGSEVFVVNNAADVLTNVTASDTIESSQSYTLPTNVTHVILIGSASLSVTGNASNDVITANSGRTR